MPAKVMQKEVAKSQLEKVKGTLKSAFRNTCGISHSNGSRVSVYDTKPVNVMTTIHMAATLA